MDSKCRRRWGRERVGLRKKADGKGSQVCSGSMTNDMRAWEPWRGIHQALIREGGDVGLNCFLTRSVLLHTPQKDTIITLIFHQAHSDIISTQRLPAIDISSISFSIRHRYLPVRFRFGHFSWNRDFCIYPSSVLHSQLYHSVANRYKRGFFD